MTESQLKQLIDRYLQGKATREEADLIDRFYDHLTEIESPSDSWSSTQKQQIKNRVYLRIQQSYRRRKKARLRRTFSIAATVVFLVICGVLIFHANSDKDQSTEPLAEEWKTATAGGEQKSILLDDGSYVLLSPGATLTYPGSFTGPSRVVKLEGEAWFDVHRDTLTTFQVITDKITATVLGTSFSINSRSDQSKVEVKVTSGKVRVASPEKDLAVLNQFDQFEYESGVFTVTQEKDRFAQNEKLPEPGEWKLANVNMEEAAQFLKKHWKKEIVFENPDIRKCLLYASFNSDDTLEEILVILCGITNSEYRMDENNIAIYGNGCVYQEE